MRDSRPVRRAAIRLGGVTLAGAAVLVGVAGPADQGGGKVGGEPVTCCLVGRRAAWRGRRVWPTRF